MRGEREKAMDKQEVIANLKKMREILDSQEVPEPYYVFLHPKHPCYKLCIEQKWEEIEPYVFKVPQGFWS